MEENNLMFNYLKRHTFFLRCFSFTFLLMIISIVCLLFISNQTNKKVILEQRRQSDVKDLTAINQNISTLTDSIEDLAALISSDSNIKNMLINQNTSDDIILSTNYINNTFVHISTINNNYLFVNDNKIKTQQMYCFFSPAYLQSLSKTDPTWTESFSLYFNDSPDYERCIAYLYPINEGNNFLGFNVFFISIKQFQNIISPYSESTYILQDGLIIANKANYPYYKKFYDLFNFFYTDFKEDKSFIMNANKTTYIANMSLCKKLNMQIVNITPYKEILAQLNDVMPNFSYIAFISIPISLILSFILSNILVKPITKLKMTIEKINSGNFSIRHPVKSQNEIGQLIITINSLLDKIEKLLADLKENYTQKLNMQFKLIQAQINPHFLYNILETTCSLIRCNMYNESIQAIDSLASFYRISLNKGADIISIEDEVSVTENYLKLQGFRYVEFMEFSLAISPNILKYTIPKLTLQPLVENAIYHGLKEKDKKGLLFITAYLENNIIYFEIYDNGKGISQDKLKELQDTLSDPESSNHFGLKSVLKRLNIFSDNKANLQINSEEDEYTCITISYPASET